MRSSRTSIRTSIRNVSLIGLAAAALLLLAASASAVNNANPGTNCVKAGSSQTLDYYHGRAQNMHTASVIVDCPITTTNFTGVDRGTVIVRAIDRHYSQDISCTLLVYNNTATYPEYYFQSRRTSGSNNAATYLRFDNIGYPTNWAKWPSQLIGCSLPGTYYGNRSELISYEVYPRD